MYTADIPYIHTDSVVTTMYQSPHQLSQHSETKATETPAHNIPNIGTYLIIASVSSEMLKLPRESTTYGPNMIDSRSVTVPATLRVSLTSSSCFDIDLVVVCALRSTVDVSTGWSGEVVMACLFVSARCPSKNVALWKMRVVGAT